MNQNQARAIAKATSYLRPEWTETSLFSLLSSLPAARRDMPARDVMLALTWIAYDPATREPGRLKIEGPWWHVADRAARTEAAPEHLTTQWCPTHDRPYLHECRYCRDGQSLDAAGTTPPEDLRARMRADVVAAQDLTKGREYR